MSTLIPSGRNAAKDRRRMREQTDAATNTNTIHVDV